MLLANGYAVWIAAWTLANTDSESFDFLGVGVQRLGLPTPLVVASVAVAGVTGVAVTAIVARRVVASTPTAWTGLVAYLVSLYAWSIVVRFNPIVLIVAPALHSLQYLYVVKRYHTNRHNSGAASTSWRAQYGLSVGLGLVMFLVVPMTLDRVVSFDAAAVGSLPFSFMFMIGINVHHYFLDNVMWRRGNPEVSKHLFA